MSSAADSSFAKVTAQMAAVVTKYNIGDTVFFTINQIPYKAKVRGISISIVLDNSKLKTLIAYSFHDFTDYKEESELFSSKEDLYKYLIEIL